MANQQLANLQQNAAQQQAIQQQIQQIQLQQQQLQLQSQAGIQNVQLMTAAAAQSGLPQVILQSQQMPTVSSGVSLQQSLPTQIPQSQASIMTKAGTHQILQMPSSQAAVASVSTSLTNAQIITSIAGTVASDTSSSILGPLSSPQTPLQPPQNPLIAMTTLSASPMANIGMSTKVDAASGENKNVTVSIANSIVTSSPLKHTQADEKKDSSKKSDENKKSEESSSSNKSHPSTPVKTVPASSNSPLATQNGEDGKKNSTTPVSAPLLKNELPKALVKPNVLTHVIEGFVIQESNEPFPVTRQRYSEKENDEPPKKKMAVETENKANESSPKVNGESSSSVSSSTPIQSPSEKQERGKQKRKRKTSAEGSSVVSTNNGDTSLTASPSQGDKSKTEGESEVPSVEEHIMMKWSVSQVCEFIKNLPGCSDYADDFALQEIDGQALLLLKENHLVSAMGMKLGPALKIVNKIESMRVTKDPEASDVSGEAPQSQATP